MFIDVYNVYVSHSVFGKNMRNLHITINVISFAEERVPDELASTVSA